MLAIANKHGEVQASIPGLAQIAWITLVDTEKAIGKFLSPDKYSRTPDDEGRRIERIDGGWLLLNHAKYRAMASKDEEKTASAKRQAAFRDRQRRNEKVTASNGGVTDDNDPVTGNRDIAEAEADTKANPLKEKRTPSALSSRGTLQELKAYALEIGLPQSDGESMFDHWESNGWKNGSNLVKDWKAGIRKWKSQGWLPSQKNAGFQKSTAESRQNPAIKKETIIIPNLLDQ